MSLLKGYINRNRPSIKDVYCVFIQRIKPEACPGHSSKSK